MKILFISDVYFPRINGVSTSIETFRRELRDLGHTVDLIAPDYLSPSSDESGIERIPSRQLPFDPEDRLMQYKRIMAMQEQLRAKQYDIIHIQTPFVAHYAGIKLARALNIPCIETYHTFFEEYFHHYIPLLPKVITGMLARRLSCHQGNSLDGMVIPSRPMADILHTYGVTTHAEVIPTGIELESFTPGDRYAFRGKYNLAQDKPLLLFVGRVAHEKNIGFLLRVIDRVRCDIPEALLLVAGEGPARADLEHEAHKLNLGANVRFIGYLDRHTELNNCYCAADIFVFSSRTETQGLVLLEAMAQGVPVVSTAEMGTKDVLREGAGVWIAREEVEEFSGKIIKMLRDNDARTQLGIAAREYALGWSARRQAERMLDFYQNVIAKHR
jgi:1,2-diacylglycerol 3-alpha-glucosyltransferase